MIFRRYEIRSRSLITGKDLETGLPWERFFFRTNAVNACKTENAVRLIFGSVAFEFYIHDRRSDV